MSNVTIVFLKRQCRFAPPPLPTSPTSAGRHEKLWCDGKMGFDSETGETGEDW